MRHAILGVGGVGGLIAAVLANAGDDVLLILRPEVIDNYPAELTMESSFGNIRVPVRKAIKLDEPVDVLWVTVKATQLHHALASVANPEQIGSVVPLLNGIDHIAALRTTFDRVVPASISVESERVSPGHIVQRSPFIRMNIATPGKERLDPAIRHLQQFGFVCHYIDDEATLLWRKLVFLAPLALTGTAADATTGEMQASDRWRGLYENCVREVARVAKAHGADVDSEQIIGAFALLAANMRSSMQKDVSAGNPPELDAIAGPILRGADKHGTEIPATRELVSIIKDRLAAATR